MLCRVEPNALHVSFVTHNYQMKHDFDNKVKPGPVALGPRVIKTFGSRAQF